MLPEQEPRFALFHKLPCCLEQLEQSATGKSTSCQMMEMKLLPFKGTLPKGYKAAPILFPRLQWDTRGLVILLSGC